MALIKFGGGVIQASGSIAGNTFARNRFGNYQRARTVPVNPNSSGQSAVRTALAALAERWNSTVTAAQRTAWDTYAAAVAMTNRLGETIYLTGFNHYIRSNLEILRQGHTIVDDGPTVLSLPDKDVTFAASGSAAAQLLSITFDNVLDWANEDDAFMFVYMGQPQLATRTFFAAPWRFVDEIAGNSTTPPTSPDTMTAPFTLVQGQKVWVYGRIVRADGRLSEQMYAAPLLVAA